MNRYKFNEALKNTLKEEAMNLMLFDRKTGGVIWRGTFKELADKYEFEEGELESLGSELLDKGETLFAGDTGDDYILRVEK